MTIIPAETAAGQEEAAVMSDSAEHYRLMFPTTEAPAKWPLREVVGCIEAALRACNGAMAFPRAATCVPASHTAWRINSPPVDMSVRSVFSVCTSSRAPTIAVPEEVKILAHFSQGKIRPSCGWSWPVLGTPASRQGLWDLS